MLDSKDRRQEDVFLHILEWTNIYSAIREVWDKRTYYIYYSRRVKTIYVCLSDS